MAEIVKIKKDGVIQYPITKPECVIDENGKNVLQLIKENGGGSTPDLSGYLTKEEFNKASEDFATTDALEGKQDTIEDLNSIRSGAEKGATAVQPSILEDYATTQQLTELSAEVSGLSEKIENLPTAESSVFEAVYGVTTYDELVAAVKAKKHVICFYNNRVYNLCNYQENKDIFFSGVTSAIFTVSCAVANGKWTASQYNFENTVFKVTSLSASSTDTQYPSAKAVYDFVNNTLGTIINGDY